MRRRLLASLLGSALVLSACAGATETAGPGSDPTPQSPPAASAPASPEATGGATDGSSSEVPGPSGQNHQALAFEAPLVQGGTFDGAVSGDVVVWFWAPW